MANNSNQHTCAQCGSELIVVSQETVLPEGARFKQTNTVYNCSNANCQKSQDREKADRLKQQQKRMDTAKQRTENIQEKRKLLQKLKLTGD